MKKLFIPLVLLLAACSTSSKESISSDTVKSTTSVDEVATTEPHTGTEKACTPAYKFVDDDNDSWGTCVAKPTTTTQAATTTSTIPVISAGTYEIGTQIKPGLYRVSGYWALLDNSLEIVENDGVYDNGLSLLSVPDPGTGTVFVEISGEAVDVFSSGPLDPILADWNEGTYLVNVDIQPGRYMVSDPEGAYASRLNLLPNGEWDIIDNNLNDGSVIIDIAPTDFAFQFSGKLEKIN